MIIETIYTAESKKERKALQMMAMTIQDAGMEIVFSDNLDNESGYLCELRVKESRRKRSSKEVNHSGKESTS